MTSPQTLPPDTPILPRRAGEERPLIVIMAIMTCLAGITLLLSIAGFRTSQIWQAENERALTVQILPSGAQEDMATRAQAVLRAALPGAKVSTVDAAESRRLLEPWIGDVVLPPDLPLPLLLKVQLREDVPNATEILTEAYSRAKIEVLIDDHSRWRSNIRRTWASVRLAMWGIILLVMIASGAIISYATRSVLRARQPIIDVLTQVGAPDGYIIQLFTRRFFMLALKAACLGGALALAALIIFSAQTKLTAADILPHTGLHLSDLFWLILLMAAMAFISGLTAIVTTRALLLADRPGS